MGTLWPSALRLALLAHWPRAATEFDAPLVRTEPLALRYGHINRGMTMRPRKNLLPLSLESLREFMASGRAYSVPMLACIFDASPASISAVLTTLVAEGAAKSRREPRQLESRRVYWLVRPALIADRRMHPAHIPGELVGYDLTRLPRLCMAVRR